MVSALGIFFTTSGSLDIWQSAMLSFGRLLPAFPNSIMVRSHHLRDYDGLEGNMWRQLEIPGVFWSRFRAVLGKFGVIWERYAEIAKRVGGRWGC